MLCTSKSFAFKRWSAFTSLYKKKAKFMSVFKFEDAITETSNVIPTFLKNKSSLSFTKRDMSVTNHNITESKY